MLKSMTGFARRDFEKEALSASLTIKSYNNRYLDISLSIPPFLAGVEPTITSLLGSRIRRGKIECFLRIKSKEGSSGMKVDLELAKAVHKALVGVAEACGMGEGPSLDSIARFEGVVGREGEADAQALWKELEPEFLATLSDFDASRAREGKATQDNVLKELSRFTLGLETVKASAGIIEKTLETQLRARFEEMLPRGFDEQRMLQEVAVQLVRFGINEEISRLDAHIEAFGRMMAEEGPGKKLDFLCQEMNRETNTIGSKNILIPVAHAVVEMKDALENIREQLRNVE